jgi:two-component system, NtrC family, sensor kinase
VVIIDAATRRIEQVNPAAAALFGAVPDQIVGRVCHRHLCPAQERQCPVLDLGGEVDDSPRELLRADGSRHPIRKTVRPFRVGGRQKLLETFTSISEQQGRQEQYRALFECSRDALMALAPPSWHFTRANPACIRLFAGRNEQDILSYEPWMLSPDFQPDGRPSPEKALEMIHKAVAEGSNFFEWTHRRLDGHDFPATVLLTRMTIGGESHLQAAVRDISEQRQTEARLEEERQTRESVEMELWHSQRHEAAGQLAVGVAQEITTSAQLIGDNTMFLREAFGGLTAILDAYRDCLATLAAKGLDPSSNASLAAAEAAAAGANLDHLIREIPAAIGQSLDGLGQVSRIASAMKDFVHPGSGDREAVDLNKAIEATILVTRNKWKYVAELETDLDPRLPEVPCFIDQINQAILDLIVNAAHAIEDTGIRARGEKGSIRISTRQDGGCAEIRISDTGAGIPEERQARVFAARCTAGDFGPGAGQGLAIAHDTVVRKHGGTIHFETQAGKGTTFVVRLPVEAAERAAA